MKFKSTYGGVSGFAMIEGLLTAALIMLGIAGAMSTSQSVSSLKASSDSTDQVTHAAREYSFLLYQFADSLKGGTDNTPGNGNGNAFGVYKKLAPPDYKAGVMKYCQAMVAASQGARKRLNGGGSNASLTGQQNSSPNSAASQGGGNGPLTGRNMIDVWSDNLAAKVPMMDFMLESCTIADLPPNTSSSTVAIYYSYNDLMLRKADDGRLKNYGQNPNCPMSAGNVTRPCDVLYLTVVQPNS